MKVYHGSTTVIEHPDINHSKRNLDFGPGFYLTTFRKQAERWASRKSDREKAKAIINEYELKENLNDFKILRFDSADEKWLDFVCSNRRGDDVGKQFDMIIGNVANDEVFKVVDMYFSGLWDKDRALKELKFYKKNDQICIKSQCAIIDLLTYTGSYEMEVESG